MQFSELGNILRIGRAFDTYRRQVIKEPELHPGLQILLSHICRNPGCSQEFLVERVGIDKTTVAHHLVRLEEKGYIERRVSSHDARMREVYPTSKAEAIYPKLHEAHEVFHEALLKGLSKKDKQELSRLSDILYQNARELIRQNAKGKGEES